MSKEAVSPYYWLLGLALLLFLAALPFTIEAQGRLVVVLLLAVWLSGRFSHLLKQLELQQLVRIAVILLASFVTLRYFFWRTTTTIEYHDMAFFNAHNRFPKPFE